MNLLFLIPFVLGISFTLALWTAARLIFWSRKPQNLAGAIAILGMALIMIGYLVQLVGPAYAPAQVWIQLQGVGFYLFYPHWLVFVLFITGNEKRAPRPLIFLFALLSVVPLALQFVPAASAWFLQIQGFVQVGPLYGYRMQSGWMLMVTSLVGQVEGGISSLLLFRQISRVRPEYRLRIAALFLAPVLLFITGGMEFSGANPIAPFSPIILAMVPVSLVVSQVIFSLRIGQVLPVIREKVVDSMRDSVLLVDAGMRVAYMNPAAIHLLHMPHPLPANAPLADLFPELIPCLEACPTRATERDDATVPLGDMIYSVSRSVLEDWKGKIIGQTLVLRNITDHERMEQALQARAEELARSSAFTQALSQVAAKVSASEDIEQIFHTLGDEFERLGIHFYIALRTPGETGYIIRYLNFASRLIKQMERMAGFKLRELKLPGYETLASSGGMIEDGAIYYPRVTQTLNQLFVHTPVLVEQATFKIVGISPLTAGFIFRLPNQVDEKGIFCVWGDSLRHEDLPALSVFAAQISAAMQKVRLIDSEQQRVAELERVNGFVTALSQVAARFEANLNLEQVAETISAELKRLGAECVIALIDPETDELAGQYTSVASAIWNACERITGLTLADFRIPYQDWRALTPQSDSPAFIIEDAVDFASRVMHGLPKALLKQTIPMVGITPDKPAVWAPLSARGRAIGILIMWGIPQPQAYLPAVTLFARQSASAIEKARLMSELETLKTFNEGIVQGVAEAIIILDANLKMSFANPAAAKLFGAKAGALVGQSWFKFSPPEEHSKLQAQISQISERQAAGNDEAGIELTVLRSDGNRVPVLAKAQTRFVKGRLESILVSLTDIEQRVKTEQQIRASMQEKEAMLKEIHHRVKNNLQIISSLLNLQSNQLKDEKALEFFRESQNRIRSMALIHEKLYRSDNLASIPFDEYIRELGSFLLNTYNDHTRRIQLEVQADPVHLDLDTAIPCSLIINELVSNALKYGFPPGHPALANGGGRICGRICVQLAKQADNRIQLIVSDNGAGFPADLDFRRTGSLGLQLVHSLARQLAGEVSFSNQDGAHVEIVFEWGK